MKFIELIDRCITEQLPVFINGMPEDGGGKVIKREEDYIVFEVTNIAEKQEEITKERINIPTDQIHSLSSGERKAGTLTEAIKK